MFAIKNLVKRYRDVHNAPIKTLDRGRRWMSIGEILAVNRAWLRSRYVLLAEVLAVLGLSIGVALLFASQVASTSLDSSVRELTDRIAGSTQLQLESRDGEGFDQRLLARVQRAPGVKAALPLIERPATLLGPKGQMSVDLIGADPRFARIGGLPRLNATQLANQKGIALPSSVATSLGVGALEQVKIQVGSNVSESYVGTTLGAHEIQGLSESQIVLAPIRYTQQLADMPRRLSRIFVQTRPGQEVKAKASLSKLAVQEGVMLAPANFDARLFSVASAPAQQGEGLFSTISAIVGFLFAFNAMLLTVPARRKLIAEMRGYGTARAMTLQFLCCEALVLGLLGGALGLALGQELSAHFFHTEPGYLSFAFPVGSARIVTGSTIALSVGVGLLAAFAGVLGPLQPFVARPLRVAHTPRRRQRPWTPLLLGAGALSLAGTTAILILRPQAAVAGNATLIVALLCLLPILFGALVTAFEILQRPLGSTSTRLARIALREPATRGLALTIAATGAVAVFGSVAILGAQQNLQHGLDETAREVNDATDLWVSAAGTNNTLGTTAFPSAIAAKLQGAAGVQSVSIYRGGFLDLGYRRAWIVAPPRSSPQPIPPGQLTEGDFAQASTRLRGHGWAVLSEAIAREMHLHIGQRFTLPSPLPSTFRVAALSTNGGWPPGAILINASDYARAWKSTAASALMVALRSGVTTAAGQTSVRRALGADSGLSVQTAAQRAREWQTISHQGLDRLTEIAKLVMIAAVLAMAGAMSSMISQRRGEIAYVKRQGHTKGIVWRALFIESAVLLGAGCSIGAMFGAYGALVISHALATITGFPVVFSTGAAIALVSFAIVSAAALAIVAIPGYLAARVRASNVPPT